MIINGYAVTKGVAMYSKAQQQWVMVVDPDASIIQTSSGQKFTRTAEGAIMLGEPQDLFWTIEEAKQYKPILPVQKKYFDGIQKGMTVFWITVPCKVVEVLPHSIVINSPSATTAIDWKMDYKGRVGNEPVQTVFWAPLEYKIPPRKIQKTGFINIYSNLYDRTTTTAGAIHPTKEAAEVNAAKDRVDCIPITWTEPG